MTDDLKKYLVYFLPWFIKLKIMIDSITVLYLLLEIANICIN